MKIEKTQVFGFEAAIRGARNAMESWDRSDSCGIDPEYPKYPIECTQEDILVGPADLKLLSKLVKAGNEHAKSLRMVQVWVDFTIPRYIHTELDTYKVGTTRCSCSTRPNTLKKSYFTLDMFETTGLLQEDTDVLQIVINHLNKLNKEYQDMNGREGSCNILKRLKKLLPEVYLQKATFNFNYQTLRNIYLQRKNHWLDEWHIICDYIKSLPYAKELIIVEK